MQNRDPANPPNEFSDMVGKARQPIPRVVCAVHPILDTHR